MFHDEPPHPQEILGGGSPQETSITSTHPRHPPSSSQRRHLSSSSQHIMDDILEQDEQQDDESWNAEDEPQTTAEQEASQRAAEMRETFRQKTGRCWSDPFHDINDMIEAHVSYEDLPDWDPKYVSQISLERVQLYGQRRPENNMENIEEPPRRRGRCCGFRCFRYY